MPTAEEHSNQRFAMSSEDNNNPGAPSATASVEKTEKIIDAAPSSPSTKVEPRKAVSALQQVDKTILRLNKSVPWFSGIGVRLQG